MDQFWIKFVSLFVAAAAIFGYNAVLKNREQAEKIDALEYELSAKASQTATTDSSEVSQPQTSSAEDDSSYKDGVYEGEAQGFGGDIRLSLTVEKGSITDIEILSADGEDGAYLDTAKAIIDDIITAQTYDVDTVSGATFSSTGIKNATKEALGKAEK